MNKIKVNIICLKVTTYQKQLLTEFHNNKSIRLIKEQVNNIFLSLQYNFD
jgi:hypothetical protein